MMRCYDIELGKRYWARIDGWEHIVTVVDRYGKDSWAVTYGKCRTAVLASKEIKGGA